MALNGLVQKAVKLIRGVEVRQDDARFVFSVLSVVPGFKVSEIYLLSGDLARCNRRDLRGGAGGILVGVGLGLGLGLGVGWGWAVKGGVGMVSAALVWLAGIIGE